MDATKFTGSLRLLRPWTTITRDYGIADRPAVQQTPWFFSQTEAVESGVDGRNYEGRMSDS